MISRSLLRHKSRPLLTSAARAHLLNGVQAYCYDGFDEAASCMSLAAQVLDFDKKSYEGTREARQSLQHRVEKYISLADKVATRNVKLKSEEMAARRREFERVRKAEKNAGLIKKDIVEEVRRKPWVTIYGELPASAFSIFAANMREQRSYSLHQLKVAWDALTVSQRRIFNEQFDSVRKKRIHARSLISASSTTARTLFMSEEIKRLMNTPGRHDINLIARRAAHNFKHLPYASLVHYEELASQRRAEAHSNLNELIRIRTDQVLGLQTELPDFGDAEKVELPAIIGDDEEVDDDGKRNGDYDDDDGGDG
eukprot:PhM_4_TR15609/c0_g1_i1/m.13829